MSNRPISCFKQTLTGCTAVAIALALFALPTTLSAQSRDAALQNQYPEIAQLFNAFDVVQANMFAKLAEIGAAPATQEAQNQFEDRLVLMATSSMQEIMEMAMEGTLMDTAEGPFDELESAARLELGQTVRAEISNTEAVNAIRSVAALSDRTAAIIQHGRSLEAAVYNIYADPSITDKVSAVDTALSTYQSEPQLAVPAVPKVAALMFSHDQATAFLNGYPS